MKNVAKNEIVLHDPYSDARCGPPMSCFFGATFLNWRGGRPLKRAIPWLGFCMSSFICDEFEQVQGTATWFIKVSFFEGSIDLTFDETHFVVSEMVR